ncbi:hypothetical protein BXZ70DRAFT_934862 [Cristinia sonorae]|uniref:RRM domain-containing protein n=1 Tax=Cristinia sonorae TaxID=1940300 RepID=A0A8K0XQE3_9AGAR|nr:hypothetical protein BXZ70DRAFT_934862 [Cristinia sonorae]
MQAQVGRLNHYHGPKRQLLGNTQGAAAPAWKINQQQMMMQKRKPVVGSKILLSELPVDVSEMEVQSLFSKTIGPLKGVIMVYNDAGKSKGMAIVEFQRPGDALLARKKYNKKIIDGRRPILIEIIKDEDDGNAPPMPPQPLSLLERMGGVGGPQVNGVAPKAAAAPKANAANGAMNTIAARKQQQAAQRVQGLAQNQNAAAPAAPRQRTRTKKGPRRLKKALERKPVDKDQLDKEMEDYRAQTDDPSAMKS